MRWQHFATGWSASSSQLTARGTTHFAKRARLTLPTATLSGLEPTAICEFAQYSEVTGRSGVDEAPHALKRIPFFSLSGLVQAPPVFLRRARGALDEFRQHALTKPSAFGGTGVSEQVQAQVGLARAEGLVRSARTYWYHEVQMVLETALHARHFAWNIE